MRNLLNVKMKKLVLKSVPECDFLGEYRYEMIEHFKEEHNFNFESINFNFDNYTLFENWKKDIHM